MGTDACAWMIKHCLAGAASGRECDEWINTAPLCLSWAVILSQLQAPYNGDGLCELGLGMQPCVLCMKP